MKRPVATVLLLGLLALSGPASAVLCTIDDVPAATLLLPYFEVDLASDQGVTTLFSINNASATAILGHVVMWTDWSAPTIDFDVYLTGYDVITVNLRDVFNGNLPVTASAGQDPMDLISPHGPISQDINFASCNAIFPYENPVVAGTALSRLLNGHTGQPIPSLGGRCLGADHGDGVARGYITVDTVNQCSLALDPTFPGYFIDGGGGIATAQNTLWGDFFYVDPLNNFAQGNGLVHIEANGLFNAFSTPTNYTFYGRYTAPTGGDNREPLATQWGVRYLVGGGAFDGTELVVWRDSTANNVLPAGAICNVGPDWFPLNETQVVAFNEEEDAAELCFFEGGVISPPDFNDPACFPYETGRYPVTGDLGPPFDFGWLYLNLNIPPDIPTGDVDFGSDGTLAQSWVMGLHSAEGRFSVGYSALAIIHACVDQNPLLPI